MEHRHILSFVWVSALNFARARDNVEKMGKHVFQKDELSIE